MENPVSGNTEREPNSSTQKSLARRSGSEIDIGIVLKLIDSISDGNGEEILDALQSNPENLDSQISRIARSRSLSRHIKLQRTINTMENNEVIPDFAYVGLPEEAKFVDFKSAFDGLLRPRLGKRAEGFGVIFERLDSHIRPLIIETGCLRIPDNWEGDGQSTFQFDWYARERGGSVFTIDVNQESIDSTRRACGSNTNAILNDSRPALDALGRINNKAISLLYLDSFDLDLENPMPSAVHHATEMMAARHLIGEGTIICVDDFDVSPLGAGGKGLIVDQFMTAIGARVLYSGYQKIWEM